MFLDTIAHNCVFCSVTFSSAVFYFGIRSSAVLVFLFKVLPHLQVFWAMAFSFSQLWTKLNEMIKSGKKKAALPKVLLSEIFCGTQFFFLLKDVILLPTWLFQTLDPPVLKFLNPPSPPHLIWRMYVMGSVLNLK